MNSGRFFGITATLGKFISAFFVICVGSTCKKYQYKKTVSLIIANIVLVKIEFHRLVVEVEARELKKSTCVVA